VYEHGQPIGYAELNQASLGLQLGGQTFSELILLPDLASLREIQSGDFDVGANASAVVVTAGAGASATGDAGMSIFVMPKGGVMAELSLSGQTINYAPMA
jgi:lipid-binding SYLF domain-containing protein